MSKLETTLDKLNSDRLWVALGYFAVLVANAKLNLGLTDDLLVAASYVAVAFILGKSLRGTAAGKLLEGVIEGVNKTPGDDKGKPRRAGEKVAAAVETAKDVIDAVPDKTKEKLRDKIEDAVSSIPKPPAAGSVVRGKPPKRD